MVKKRIDEAVALFYVECWNTSPARQMERKKNPTKTEKE